MSLIPLPVEVSILEKYLDKDDEKLVLASGSTLSITQKLQDLCVDNTRLPHVISDVVSRILIPSANAIPHVYAQKHDNTILIISINFLN